MSKYEQERTDINRVKINLLNDIKGNNLKLNKVSPLVKNKKSKSRDNRVPSLYQIQNALHNLNQTDVKLY